MTMKAWRLDRLGGDLRLENVPMPEVRPGSILVRVEASTLMSYIKPYVEGRCRPITRRPAASPPAATASAPSRRPARTSGSWHRVSACLSHPCSARPRT